MERRKFLEITAILAAGMTAVEARGNPTEGGPGIRKKGNGSSLKLSEAQLDELFFIYQEEKLARDVYITLGLLYPKESTFAYIQKSEQRHIDAAQKLCETYNIDLSEVQEQAVGNFVLPKIQEYYDLLVIQGSVSLEEAIVVGIFIEELDINDLTKAIEDMGMPQEVINTYENLREGSYNYLEAFQDALTRV